MVLNKIGLTGATGMLGRHVRAALAHAGAQVIAVSRPDPLQPGAGGWDLAQWRSLAELDALFAGAQAVVHAGALVQTNGAVDEALMLDTNVRACVNLGQWAVSRNIPLVHVSSASVYADPGSDQLDEDAPLAWSGLGGFYGLSKLLAEDSFKRLGQQSGHRFAIVRPSSLYGAGMSAAKMVASFLARAHAGQAIELVPPVDDQVDFIHAADVAQGIVALLKAQAWGTFNLASGHTTSVRDLAAACVEVAGHGSVRIDEGAVSARSPLIRFALHTDRARQELGWQPQIDLRTGLRMLLQDRVHASDVAPLDRFKLS